MQQTLRAGTMQNSNGGKPPENIKLHPFLIGFEGTGEQIYGTTNWATNVYGKRSFVNRCCDRATEKEYAKYMAGPDMAGRELGNILSDAYDFYDLKKRHAERSGEGLKVSIVGYSRGGYLAMCFAKYLQLKGVKVKFLGLFDAVARDFTGSMPAEFRAYKIPANVSVCYHAIRRRNFSREPFENVGLECESADTGFKLREIGGTHAALGGFPMDTPETKVAGGVIDISKQPYIIQGIAEKMSPGLDVKPIEERVAWQETAKFISEPAVTYNVINRPILQ